MRTLRRWSALIAILAFVLSAAELCRRLGWPAGFRAAVLMMIIVPAFLFMALLIVVKPGPRRDLAAYILMTVAATTSFSLFGILPARAAQVHPGWFSAELRSWTHEKWILSLSPVAAGPIFCRLIWVFFPFRCPACGKLTLIRSIEDSGYSEWARQGMWHYWCACCGVRQMTCDRVTWLDASSQMDAKFYDAWTVHKWLDWCRSRMNFSKSKNLRDAEPEPAGNADP